MGKAFVKQVLCPPASKHHSPSLLGGFITVGASLGSLAVTTVAGYTVGLRLEQLFATCAGLTVRVMGYCRSEYGLQRTTIHSGRGLTRRAC